MERIRIPKAYTASEIEEQISTITELIIKNLEDLLLIVDKAKANNLKYDQSVFDNIYEGLSNVQINVEDADNFIKGRNALNE